MLSFAGFGGAILSWVRILRADDESDCENTKATFITFVVPVWFKIDSGTEERGEVHSSEAGYQTFASRESPRTKG
jgi:hypothetical protein